TETGGRGRFNVPSYLATLETHPTRQGNHHNNGDGGNAVHRTLLSHRSSVKTASQRMRFTRTAVLAALALSLTALPAYAMDGLIMKDGKVMMMKDGKPTTAMPTETDLSDGTKVTTTGVVK